MNLFSSLASGRFKIGPRLPLPKLACVGVALSHRHLIMRFKIASKRLYFIDICNKAI